MLVAILYIKLILIINKLMYELLSNVQCYIQIKKIANYGYSWNFKIIERL
jgi:hypothetical protein